MLIKLKKSLDFVLLHAKFRKKQLIAGLIITGILLMYLFLFRTSTGKPSPFQKEQEQLDSIFATLNTNQKIGLIVCADFSGSKPLAQFNSDCFYCYHKIFDVENIKHSQSPNNLSETDIPWLSTSYIIWNHSTDEELFLPPFHSLPFIGKTDTLPYFAKHFSSLLQSHGLNGIVIPLSSIIDINKPVNPKILTTLSLLIQESFRTPSFINILLDTLLPDKNEQPFLFAARRLNFSSISYHHRTHWSGGMLYLKDSLCSFEEFLRSPHHVYVTSVTTVNELIAEATQLYLTSPEMKDLIDQKARFVMHHKIKARKNVRVSTPEACFLIGSTAHSTLLLRWAELTSVSIQQKQQSIPLQLPHVSFILSKSIHLPIFKNLMTESCAECTFYVCTNDSIELERIIRKIPHSNTLVFISRDSDEFCFTNTLAEILKTRNTVFVQFARKPGHTDTTIFQTQVFFPDISTFYQIAAVNFLIGAENIHGNIPGNQDETPNINHFKPIRLKYSFPEDAGLDGVYLNRTIDSICEWAIANHVFPGCQVFAARNGKIIFHKTYGYHTYDKKQPVRKTDLYDIASITKIAATTLAFMKLYEQGKIDLDDRMEKYFKNVTIKFSKIKPDTLIVIDTLRLRQIDLEKLIQDKKITGDTIRLHDTLLIMIDTIIRTATPQLNIFLVPFRYMLLHCSGIVPSLPIMPFFQKDKFFSTFSQLLQEQGTINTDMKNVLYTQQYSDSSKIQVAERMYLKNRWRDTLWEMTKALGVSKRRTPQYADINMILIQITIDTLLKMGLAHYVKSEFYIPLGMYNTFFKPLTHKIPKERIPPTENDLYWRQQVIQGYVHDPSAALLGGIAGNAGLFSCARDLGILFQMLLNGGTYGNRTYLKTSTISTFTTRYEESDRGLGFDVYSPKNIIAPSASINSYGHTGFTGCCAWIDPDAQLVFVFLSNRTYPDASNWKINTYKIRQSVHEAFYEAIRKYSILNK